MNENRDHIEKVKESIRNIENSKKEEDFGKRIVMCNVDADLFLEMAYLYVGIKGISND